MKPAVFLTISFLAVCACLIGALAQGGTAVHRQSTLDLVSGSKRQLTSRAAGNRLAIMWIFGGNKLPVYFDLAVYSLLAHEDRLDYDIHIITPTPRPRYSSGKHMWSAYSSRIFFHVCSPDEWQQRISTRTGVSVNYTFATKGRKIADFKPMLGALFPDIIDPAVYSGWVYGDCDGFFGSYDSVFVPEKLFRYDVVSGRSRVGASVNTFGYGVEHNCIGSWTMMRNDDVINSLYKRSVNYASMIQHGDKVYAFDENTLISIRGERESMHYVLGASTDVRRCCPPGYKLTVQRDPDRSLIVIDMSGDFTLNDVNTVIRWQRGQPVFVSVEGLVGLKKEYKNQTVHGLFAHLLTFKYSRPSLFIKKLDELNQAASSLVLSENKTLSCFEFIVNASNISPKATGDFYSWRIC